MNAVVRLIKLGFVVFFYVFLFLFWGFATPIVSEIALCLFLCDRHEIDAPEFFHFVALRSLTYLVVYRVPGVILMYTSTAVKYLVVNNVCNDNSLI